MNQKAEFDPKGRIVSGFCGNIIIPAERADLLRRRGREKFPAIFCRTGKTKEPLNLGSLMRSRHR
jgi:hypothetical protein